MGDIDQKNACMPVFVTGADLTGTETTPVNSTVSGDLQVADLLTVGGANGAIVVSTSAVAACVGVSNLTGRKSLTVLPTDGNIYWGYSNAVTTSNGTIVYKNQMASFQVSSNVTIWLIAAASRNVRVTEGS
jgi:hypothetical protein